MHQKHLKLFPYEGAIVSLFAGGVLALSCYTWMHAASESPLVIGEEVFLGSLPDEAHCDSHWIMVKVEGAVEFPGSYRVKRGSSLKEAIEMARPLARANLSKLSLKAPLTKKMRIFVPSTKKKL